MRNASWPVCSAAISVDPLPPKRSRTFSPGRAFAVFNDGTGAALYASGWFTTAGGISADCIARWDGAAWSPLGSGMSSNNPSYALTHFDDGTGPALYAGGCFTAAGGVLSYYIARWGPSCPGGDLNCDGSVNPDDIGPFALALTDPAAYSAVFPGRDINLADLNGDGLVNGDDVPLFVAALLNP